ncbi:pyruvate ferredoxin oxidoreductase [Anaerovorax odorimutans]|uniref:Pyruvate ferredoxin oxidoreductase n=1 Tax=Anaerovorax odorimutans TaxID=109327 RepID=A0ABT1RN73_9FIRM|nr:pyruvate ferredoxin oxidoreductase [Anaerovorax odorimutans]MCQ4636632.1 pyruvate ferredoxin oxidoreductase [Anaerovorax odorimutans]
MAIRDRMSGNEAVAVAMKQINPDVMGAFPITPSTEIPQYFSEYIANGLVDTEFIAVESEHSAMSTCMGASAAGARAVTATSSAGLAFMWELLYVAASSRLPITMAVVNRALTGPININNDHSDSMGARDSGWLQMYAETNQEVYDNFIQGVLISEACRLPIMICQDGFITSHGVSNIELIEDEKVKDFVGEYKPENYLLKHENPLAVGPYGTSPYYMEVKRQQAQAMKDAMPVIKDVAEKFEDLTGRSYGFFEEYMMDDAEVALVIIGSSAGTGKEAVDRLRAEGKKVGLIKLRVFRPFPRIPLAEAMCKVKAVAIMDKAESFSNSGGPLFNEARNSLYDLENKPYAVNYIYGLGGRDITVEDFYDIYQDLFVIFDNDDPGDVYRYIGVRDSRFI